MRSFWLYFAQCIGHTLPPDKKIQAGNAATTAEVVVITMADLSDDLRLVPRMAAPTCDERYDIVCALRYTHGAQQISQESTMHVAALLSALVAVNRYAHRLLSLCDWRKAGVVLGIIVLSFPGLGLPLFASLDSSWIMGLHEAAKRQLVFGCDVGFTYGPLGYVLFPLNEGTGPTASSLLLLALYATWWTSIALIVKRVQSLTTMLLFMAGTVAFGITGQRELLCTPSVILLATSGFLVFAQVSQRSCWAMPAAVLTAVGLLSKFNIGIGCLGSFLTYLLLGPFRVNWHLAIRQGAMLIILHLVALAALFVAVNGPLSFIDDYFITSWWMASGYSSQMALTVDPAYEHVLLVLACEVALTLLIPLLDRHTRGDYAFLLLIIALPLFLTYKSSLVRCDEPHVSAGVVTFLGLLCLLLPAQMGKRGTALFRLLLPALTLGSVITAFSATRNSPGLTSKSPVDGPRHLAELFVWDRARTPLRTAFETFRASESLPANDLSYINRAMVDVYPWDISLVVANQLRWRPRYVLQSYQAFHPTLDAMGAEHYSGPHAPRFILYRYQSIDNQHPCLVDPRTWLAIYRWYDLRKDKSEQRGLLLLERRAAPRFGEPTLIGCRTVEIGEEIYLPEAADRLVLLEAGLNLTLPGKLKEQLYKVEPPNLRITYQDGETLERRLVWKNLATGTGSLVSQLPRNLGSIVTTLSGKRCDRVRSMAFLADDHYFNKLIKIQLFAIDFGTSHQDRRPSIKP